MSGKRRPKKRPVMRRTPSLPSPPPTTSPPNEYFSAMPIEHCRASQGGRLSSEEGTVSEMATSDGVLTAMTSLPASDESIAALSAGIVSQGEGEEFEDSVEEEDDVDIQSVYLTHDNSEAVSTHRPDSYYPGVHFGSDAAASTRSLWAQDLDYREIHGRLYCKEYHFPIDELEQMRESLNHQVFLHVLDGELTTIPLENPTQILDIGTGTGEWVIRMAELFPQCEVVGTDIAAIAETRSVPMNAFFEIEDAEEWDRTSNFYDLIHLRILEGAFRSWTTVYKNVFYSLKPGGWIEVLDFDTIHGFDRFLSLFSPDALFPRLFKAAMIAAERSGRKRGIAHLNPQMLIDSGFVDVRKTDYLVPITTAEKSAGKIWLISCLDSMEALFLRLLTEQMGWDPDECKESCENAAREFAEMAKDPEMAKGMVLKLSVVVARKPLNAPPQSPTTLDFPRSPDQRRANWDFDIQPEYHDTPLEPDD